jgi:hypothetical protein
MIDINKKLQQFLSTNDENGILEYKEAKNQYDFDKIGKYFSALPSEANFMATKVAFKKILLDKLADILDEVRMKVNHIILLRSLYNGFIAPITHCLNLKKFRRV